MVPTRRTAETNAAANATPREAEGATLPPADAALPRLLEELDALPADFSVALLESTASAVSDAVQGDSAPPDEPLFTELETELLLASLEGDAAAPEPVKTTKKKIPTRIRQQQEMAYLRSQVAELEQQLSQMKQEQLGLPSTDADTPSKLGVGQNALWEQIAKRQTEEKRRAEVENAKLRSLLEDQLRVAHSLEKLFTKRSLVEASEYFEPHKRMRVSALPPMGPFVPQLDHQMRKIDIVMAESGLTSIQVERSEAQMKCDDYTNEIFLERTMTKVLPFDVDRVSEAAWRRLTPNRLDLNNGFYGASLRTEDEYELNFSVETRVRRSVAQCVGSGMGCRQRIAGERVLVVWQMRNHFTGPAFLHESAGMLSRGYLVVEPLQGSDSSIIKICVHMYPQLAEPDKIQTGLLVDLALSSFNPNTQSILQMVENDLLEESLKADGNREKSS